MNNRIRSLILLACLLLAGLAFAQLRTPTSSAAANNDKGKVEPGLRAQVAAAGQGSYLVIMREQADLSAAYQISDWEERGRYVYETLLDTATKSQRNVLTYLNNQQRIEAVNSYQSFFIVNGFMVTSNVAVLDALAARPDVAGIYAESKMSVPPLTPAGIEAIEYGIDMINANDVWSTYGVTGEGVVIANVDTGVQFDHPAVDNQYRGFGSSHDFAFYDPANVCSGGVCDNNGHGTHTMGTMVGDDGGANQIGVAPGATWIAAKGCETSSCSDASLLSSAEWLLAPCAFGDDPGDASCDPNMRPNIINNSWGGGGGDAWYQASVDAWRAAGIIPVFSAGNFGPGTGTHGSPGDYCNVISVGATDSSDNIGSFSSRGPGAFAGCTDKPDVSAPGVNVRSSVPTNSYANFNGTSMAAPHVAGCAALLLSLNPNLTYDDIYDVLTTTGADLGTAGHDIAFGYGRIDCLAAAGAVGLYATPLELSICAPDDAEYEVVLPDIFGGLVTLSAVGNPAGTTASFSPNPATPPTTSTLTVGNTGAGAPGSYNIDIVGTGPSGTFSTTVELNLSNGAPAGAPTLLTPANGATGESTQPNFSWAAVAGADSYFIEIATDAGFTSVVDSATTAGTTYTSGINLVGNTTYYWRVTAVNPCGSSPAAAFSFTTFPIYCATPNVAIPDSPNPPVVSPLVVPSGSSITDLNVSVQANHTWVGDLRFILTHVDSGTSVTFIDRPGVPANTNGCSENDIDATLDDEAASPVENECAAAVPTINGTFSPNNPLSAFDGESLSGTWQVSVQDNAGLDTGTLVEWCLLPAVTGGPAPSTLTGFTADGHTNVTLNYTGAVPFSTDIYLSYNGTSQDVLLDTVNVTEADGSQDFVLGTDVDLVSSVGEVNQDYYLLATESGGSSALFEGVYHYPNDMVFVHGRDTMTDTIRLVNSGGNVVVTWNIVNSYSYPAASVTAARARSHGDEDDINATGLNVASYQMGGAGDDRLRGGNGNDVLVGGPDKDNLNGLGSTDKASYVDSPAGVTADIALGNATADGWGSNDTLLGLQNLEGSEYADNLSGNAAANFIHGHGGMDTINGRDGFDTLYGGDGNDTINGGNQDDSITAGDGDDTVDAGSGNDTVAGENGNDTIYGGAGTDSLLGHGGNDIIYGGANNDSIYGGSEIGVANNDQLYGEAGNDTIYGGSYNDAILGGAGADTLYGGDGDDSLYANTAACTNDGSVDSLNGGTHTAGDSGFYTFAQDSAAAIELATNCP